MKNLPVLDRLVIGYSPVFDPRRKLCAVRLSAFSAGGALSAADGEALWAECGQALASAPQRAEHVPPLWVSVASEPLLDSLLQAALREPRRRLIEVPSFLVGSRLPMLRQLRLQGQSLVLNGDPGEAFGEADRTCFDAHILAPGQTPQAGRKPRLAVGARWDLDFDSAFANGADAVAGWPIDEEPRVAKPSAVPPELRGVLDLMNRVEREEPVARLEAVLNADPSLAYRLLRYLNTSAFGLRAEIGSFRHALLMLGHQRLKRWLALLLVTGSQDPHSRVLMSVAARRGLILDQLAGSLADDAMRSEMFICGVFSLLDRMLHVPMDALISSVPMQQRVQQSLLGRGPYTPHLALLHAVEGGLAADIQERCEAALVSCGELNRAVLEGLALAWELD